MATDLSDLPTELRSFDVWLALHKRKENQGDRACFGCLEGQAITDDDYCLACSQYRFGYDQARASVSYETLKGAVRGALRADVSAEAIVAIVQAAISEDEADYRSEMATVLRGA